MIISISILLVTLISIIFIFFISQKYKFIVGLISIIINSGISSYIAYQAITGNSFQTEFYGGFVLEKVVLSVDALSGWFILLMNFTIITSFLYGRRYLKHYENQENNITLHLINFVINHFAMIGIYCVQNSLAFLCIWEIMAVSAFIMVIFNNKKQNVLKSGINYLIQSHISIIFLMIGFLWIAAKQNSFSFNSITLYTIANPGSVSFLLFLIFFIGFAFKAGFIPFHTWLPYAHPAAPAHVSGLMSGVIIKLGIYGILRVILLINQNHITVGYFILIISVISGIYGVLLAIVQHDLKKLLAYHSIENIGIIGIGIGIGTIGMGTHNPILIFAGFAGALLHVLNHSLFKSLLFFSAGTIFQAIHTLQIDKMGGLIKKMPHTAVLFLIASLAICGLPPFNGFISEFLIYSGLFSGIFRENPASTTAFILSISGLVIIGGLAIFCFTKAFGIIFLGSPRSVFPKELKEVENSKLLPKYMIVSLIVIIGLFPVFFVNLLEYPVNLFNTGIIDYQSKFKIVNTIQTYSFAAFIFIILSILTFAIKYLISKKRENSENTTWGCGYIAPNAKMQYSASSFIRTYRKMVEPIFKENKIHTEIKNIIPNKVTVETHFFDKIEFFLIEFPLRKLRAFMWRFNFLQKGSIQSYILFGIIFIFVVITLPLIAEASIFIFRLIKQL